jgi:hypothetical protein
VAAKNSFRVFIGLTVGATFLVCGNDIVGDDTSAQAQSMAQTQATSPSNSVGANSSGNLADPPPAIQAGDGNTSTAGRPPQSGIAVGSGSNAGPAPLSIGAGTGSVLSPEHKDK